MSVGSTRLEGARDLSAVGLVRRHPALFAVLAYALGAAVCVWGALLPGRTLVPADILPAVRPFGEILRSPAHNPVLSDSPIQFLPWFHFLSEQLHSGHLPHWNPLFLGGVKVTPNGFVSIYYPPFWLTRFISIYDAYDMVVWIHLLIACIGVRWLARRLGASQLSSFTVGLGALAAGVWFHWSLHVVHFIAMVWIPMALAAAHQVVERATPGRVASLGLIFGLWWLGGSPQFAYYGTLALGLFAVGTLLGRWRSNGRPPLAPAFGLAIGIALGAGLAAPTLWPSAVVGPTVLRSREPEGSVTKTHLSQGHLMRALIPDAKGNTADGVDFESPHGYSMDTPFVGVVALVLFGAAIGESRRRPVVLGLLAGAVVVMALSFAGWPNSVLYRHVPLYDRFRSSSRTICVLPALIIPAAALGLDGLLARRRGAVIGALLTSGFGLLAIGGWAIHVLRITGAPHRYFAARILVSGALLGVVAAVAILSRRRQNLRVGLVMAAVAFEVAFVTPRWYPSVKKATAYPPIEAMTVARSRGGRIIRVGTELTPIPTVSPVIPMVYGVMDAQGQAVLFPKTADRYLRSIDDYGTFAAAVNITPPIINSAAIGKPQVAALDVRTVLADAGIEVPGGERLGGENPVIWGVSSAGPALLVRDAQPATEEAMWSAAGRTDWEPAATAAVAGLTQPVSGRGGTARQLGLTADTETWSVSSEAGGFLRVSAGYDAGWSATIDRRPTKVYQADGLFRGVVVPPGEHRVRFHFENRAERRGLALAMMSGLILGLGGILSAAPLLRTIRGLLQRDKGELDTERKVSGRQKARTGEPDAANRSRG